MKTTFLISSIFYILGLFIGSKTIVVKNEAPVVKTTINKTQSDNHEQAWTFEKYEAGKCIKKDSLKSSDVSDDKNI